MGGMHFFNPVHKMKLVEIVRALETTQETVSVMEEVAREMGKETVLIRESPGFITSRINAMIGNEAFYMLQEGVASARDIDKALKLGLNHPMGPFELVDLVGLDTRLSILQHLHRTLGREVPPVPAARAAREGRTAGTEDRQGRLRLLRSSAAAALLVGAAAMRSRGREARALSAGAYCATIVMRPCRPVLPGRLWSWKPQLRTTLRLPRRARLAGAEEARPDRSAGSPRATGAGPTPCRAARESLLTNVTRPPCRMVTVGRADHARRR